MKLNKSIATHANVGEFLMTGFHPHNKGPIRSFSLAANGTWSFGTSNDLSFIFNFAMPCAPLCLPFEMPSACHRATPPSLYFNPQFQEIRDRIACLHHFHSFHSFGPHQPAAPLC
jgi:hypothetical protein